ncbi:hypothetical protein GALMADRAFT_216661 [Galerina marginata CBS 339.88]|uniref:Uncharacterized protein n=1 Tax=Galerina marginata (strain CBS 339.88) TaxID=685588 RepID=A0A067SB64_GALM3|nr:hypothetical protein GALMADRAFT_216661 [Galerina marginata CBS 339.88]
MSDEKEALSNSTPAPTPPQEAPPAYESLVLTNPSTNPNGPRDTWRRIGPLTQQPITLPNGPTPPPFRPPASTQKGHTRSLSSSSTSSLKGKKSWFNFSSSNAPNASSTQSASSRTVSEVRTTVCGLVRNLVVGPQEQNGLGSLSPASLGILQSCAEACSTHSMSLSGILQEKFIESHSPLYWAIVKRPPKPEPQTHNLLDRDEVAEPESTEEESDLLGALLSHSTPLSTETITELRLGCLATSDQATFQRLRLLIPQFSSISGSDQILLGASLPADDVTVEIGSGNDGAFAVNVQVPQFHKRMMISREIGLEFVARNRLWRFLFMITPDDAWYGPPPGSWCVSVSMQEPSPPTWLDARLVLPNATTNGSPKPETVNPPPVLRLKSKQMMEAPRNGVSATQVVVALEENPAFASLQYSGSSYIPADEKLTVRLEAKLRKPVLDSEDWVVS